jgi:hypothetical protein
MRYRKFPYPKDAFVLPIIFPIVFLFVCLALLVIPVIQVGALKTSTLTDFCRTTEWQFTAQQ